MAFKFKYVGWQVGISYQCPDRMGLNREYVHGLLERMSNEGMNLISFMMVSHELNDPLHDGYAWPVLNPRLRCYIDEQVLNAQPEHEFLRNEIEYAAGLGFHVQLFTNNFWWNHRKAMIGYPHIAAIHSDDPATGDWHHLAGNKDTWAMACDEAADLLAYYRSSAVSSYGWEMMGVKWSSDHAKAHADTMRNFAAYIRTVRPDIEVWHHGYMKFENGRSPKAYRSAGMDVVFPCIHLVTSENQLVEVFESSEDIPFLLHMDVRDQATANYNIPLKTPEYIEQMGKWISQHLRDNLLGVMFFNQVCASEPNQQAVLRVIERWRKMGLM
ncbi:MAG: hypothetical protein NT011_03025 [Kiritimatiellaeota bacterium]|nr:hypothetical protein [Kiritimatiellota bacterium]